MVEFCFHFHYPQMNNFEKGMRPKVYEFEGFFTYFLLQYQRFTILYKFYGPYIMCIFLYTVNFISISHHVVNPLYQFHPPLLSFPLVANSVLCIYMIDFLWLPLFIYCVCFYSILYIIWVNHMVFAFSNWFISLSIIHPHPLSCKCKISSF